MTYLEIINAVLRRLRETEVTDVNETDYSKLIGEYVNSVKKKLSQLGIGMLYAQP